MSAARAGLDALLAEPLLRDLAAGARPGLLVLDYDGTLAPFTPERDQARPWPGVAAALDRLPVDGPGRYLLVSGRDPEEVLDLLGVAAEPEVWGSHGGQRRQTDGLLELRPLPPGAAEALDRAGTSARRTLAREGAGAEHLEEKPLGLALHWRGLSPALAHSLVRDLEPAWAALATPDSGLALHPFDGGLELRPRGLDKGGALLALLAENPGTGLVFLGDDLTDEDGFRVLAGTGHGLGVLVRDGERPTAAVHRLRPPDELLAFLHWWAEGPGRSRT